jgi:hypothetical protein
LSEDDDHIIFTDADANPRNPFKPRKRVKKPSKPHQHKSGLTDQEMTDLEQVTYINLCHYFRDDLVKLMAHGGRDFHGCTTLTAHEIATLKSHKILRMNRIGVRVAPAFELTPLASYIVSTAPSLPPESDDVEEDEDE